MDAAERVREAGFPSVATLLDGSPEGVRRAHRELDRFQPCSIGEAHAKDRARRALPEVETDEE